MKKTIFALSTFVFLFFAAQTVSAQGTTVFNLNVSNGSNCAVQVQGWGFDMNCNPACAGPLITIPSGGQVSFAFPCAVIDATSSIAIRIWDAAAGAGTTVGDGCGIGTLGFYQDCTGTPRTVIFTTPNTVTIN